MPWVLDTPGNLGIGDRFSGRDFLKSLPYPLLKDGSADIQRQVQTDLWTFDEAHHPGHQTFIVAIRPEQCCLGKPVLQIPDQIPRVTSEKNRHNAFLAGRDQNGTKRRLANREPDLLVGSAGTVLRGCHTQHPGGFFIEPSAGIEACVIDCLGHRYAGTKSITDLVGPMR